MHSKNQFKSVVLLSAGLDSSVNLYQAHAQTKVVLALTVNYGQRAAAKEIQKAAALCANLGIAHKVLDLSFFKDFGRSSLIQTDEDIPKNSDVVMDDYQVSLQTAKSVWVPNRNGILLNIAAGFAESLNAHYVIPGFNKEEATTFPDNSQQFLEKLTESLSFSTGNQVQVQCYTTDLVKTEIVKLGQTLHVPWKELWPCYQAFELWCGECESCQRSRRAFVQAGVDTQGFYLKG